MALKGAEIMKMLPKTNCKECGFATCFAFAMKLATGGAELGACPHLAPRREDRVGGGHGAAHETGDRRCGGKQGGYRR